VSPRGTTVLLTGVGLDGGPDVIRALRADQALDVRVVGVDAAPDVAGRYLCDAFHEVPSRDDPGYLDEVMRIAAEEGADLIYPLPTFDQEIFASAREQLEARGVAVAVSPPEAVRVCNDKWLLYERLRGTHPELVPETHRVQSASELERVAGALGYPEGRVCIRRRLSRGAIGLRVLDAGPARLEALLNEKPGSPLVSLSEILDCLGHADPFPEYLVQEYLPGEEWDVDLLCHQGEPRISATRRSMAMVGGAAAHAVLEPSDEIERVARELVSELGLDAVVNVAFRGDESGDQKLLEINPRIPMSILSGLGGGINFVALAVRQRLGEQVDPAEPAFGGRFLLHYQSVVTDPSGSRVVD
jgi:carbamoyl-phosphate synthase large subunit